MGASWARILICFAIAAFLGTATLFLVRNRKLQMQILFLVSPRHVGGGEKIACSRDWQLEDAQGVLMCSEPDTSCVTGAALAGTICGVQLEAFPGGLS